MFSGGNVSPSRYEKAKIDDPIVSSPFAFLTSYNVSIFYLLWYLCVQHWNLSNYVHWVRFQDELLGDTPSPQVYLAFIVITETMFWLLTGPCFFYTAKYAKTKKRKHRFLTLGIAFSFIFSDVPLWILDMAIVYNYGFIDVIQGIALIMRSFSFVINSIVAWHIYLHRITKILQQYLIGNKELAEIARREDVIAERQEEGMKSENVNKSYS